jgi:hypothetical protein
MHPERIERQLKFLRANPNVDLIDTAIFTVDDELTPLGIRGDRPLDSRPGAVLRNGLLIHPTVMGRAEWFRSNRYDPVYLRSQDRELWSRTCATTKFARLCEPLFFYREASPSTCGTIFALKGPCATSCVATARRWSGGVRHGSW